LNQASLDMLSKLVEIRTVEELIAGDFIASKIFSFLHLSIGQEGSAVGSVFALGKEDSVFGNHRSHGHYLARGGDFERMIREVYGDPGGCCGGYGGSMHMLDRSVGFVGSTPILGSVAPIGVGLAFAQKIAGSDRVAVVFIGDGAAEEGAFYESLNLAGVMRCPLIFVLEDNRYAVNTPHAARKAPDYSLRTTVEGLGAIYERVDGQRVWEVFEQTQAVRRAVLERGRPAVIHVDILRNYGHSGPMKEGDVPYRLGDDPKYREENCCIRNLKQHLANAGIDQTTIDDTERNAREATTRRFTEIRKTIEVRK
jgi:TPP-dependent pyruvate/acetoin dehydrogenase alpha subunit